jgi:D-amino peptidase
MKIFIETDLEGAWGVKTMASVHRGDADFDEAYACLAGDINAAVSGAFDGGAEEVLVQDGHGALGLNFDLVDKRAQCRRELAETEVKRYDAMFCVGMHAMAGTQNAFLDHTQSSLAWFEYRVNGRPCGEIAQSGMDAAYWDAPVILLTGDEAAVAEAHNFLGELECVAVKRGVGRNSCIMYDKDETRERIRAAAERAVKSFLSGTCPVKPYKPALPMEVILTYTRCDYADQAVTATPALERIGPRTVRWIATSYRDLFPQNAK